MIENKESIIEKCKEMISDGSKRDDIDFYLKQQSYDAKQIAMIDYELQDIYVEIEKDNQRRDKGWSYIVAGIVILVVALSFTVYTVWTRGLASLSISIVMLYYAYKFYKQGREILKSTSVSKFKPKDPYTPKR